MNQRMSLMIPRVFPQWVDEETIVNIFHNQHIGNVYKVSIIRQPDSRRRNYPVYKAFIYFNAWYENEIAFNFQQRIIKKREARVVYDDPWYWVVFKNTEHRLSNNDMRIMRLGNQLVTLSNYTETIEARLAVIEDKHFQQMEHEAESALAEAALNVSNNLFGKHSNAEMNKLLMTLNEDTDQEEPENAEEQMYYHQMKYTAEHGAESVLAEEEQFNHYGIDQYDSGKMDWHYTAEDGAEEEQFNHYGIDQYDSGKMDWQYTAEDGAEEEQINHSGIDQYGAGKMDWRWE